MQADLPHTLYDFKKQDTGKPNTVASDEVIRRQEEANRRMAEEFARMEREKTQGERPYEIEELFKE